MTKKVYSFTLEREPRKSGGVLYSEDSIDSFNIYIPQSELPVPYPKKIKLTLDVED